jgi:hypothetical protein
MSGDHDATMVRGGGGGNDRINSRFGFKSAILIVIIAIIIIFVIRIDETTTTSSSSSTTTSSLSSIQHNFTINDSMQRGESLQLLAEERDDDATVLNRARDHFLIAESLAIAQNRRHDANHAHAAAADAALLRDAAADSLRNVVPLAPWLLGRTYSSDLFDDVLPDVLATAVDRALLPLADDSGWWVYTVVDSDADHEDAASLLLLARAAVARHHSVSLVAQSHIFAALDAEQTDALFDHRATVSAAESATDAAARLCEFLRLSKVAALSVVRVGDVDDRLVRIRATLVQTFPAPVVRLSSADAVGENRVEDATLATRLFLLALVVAIIAPPLLRAVDLLDSPAVDSDAYMMRFIACPCGVLLGALAPSALDHIFSSFLPMLLPESPTQLARSGMSYPIIFAIMLQLAPLAMVAALAPRVPRLADALRERWLAPALGLGIGLGGGAWLSAGHMILRGSVGGVWIAPPLMAAVLFFGGRATCDALGGLAARHAPLRMALSGVAATVVSLDAMLVGSTAPMLHDVVRSAALALCAAAVGYEFVLNALRGKQRSSAASSVAATARARGGDGDETTRDLLAKDFDALRQRVTASHGLPLVGNAVTAKQQLCEAIELDEPFRFIVLRGPRGFGKSRTIADTLAEAGSAVATFVGDASGHEQSDSSDSRCAPYEPIRKALGAIVGVNRFKSAKEQWALVEGAADFAESVSGLGLVLGLESGGGGGGGDGGGGAPIDSAVLADAVVRAVTREARDAQRRKQRMVLLFEDMEHCDNESGQLLIAAVGELARRGAAAPLTLVVCERDEQGAEPTGWLQSCLVAAAAASSASAASSTKVVPTLSKRGSGASEAALQRMRHEHSSPSGTLVTLQPLCESDVAQLLERIGFQPTFAAAAAPSLNERAAGSPLWLGAMLRVLVSNREQLESTTNGWRLPTGTSIDDIELPSEIKAALLHTLGQLSEKQLRILHFASHVGVEFEASIVANAMGIAPMELLWELVQIESVLGVIHDVADVDDLFRFSSGGFVAALRGYACELLSHVSHDQPPQLTRQCHLQIADALVKHEADVVNAQTLQDGISGVGGSNDAHALGVPERSPAAWFRLARHAVAAGTKRGALAFVACCAAARAARSQSALDAAIRYGNLALDRESSALAAAALAADPSVRAGVVTRADNVRVLLAESLLFVTAKNSAQALRVISSHSQPSQPAAQVVRALAHAYAFNLADATALATELAEREGDVPAVSRAEALWVLTFAAMKGDTAASWELSQSHAKRAMQLLRAEVVDEASTPLLVSSASASTTTAAATTAAGASTTNAAVDDDDGAVAAVADLLRRNERYSWLVDRRDANLKRASKCIAAKTLGVIGSLFIHCVKDLNAAEIAVRHSMTLKRDVGDMVGRGIAASQLALVLMRRAAALGRDAPDYDKLLADAVLWLNENEQISHKLGSEIGLVLAPKSLGECALLRNDARTALAHFERCRERSARFRDTAIEIAALCGLFVATVADVGERDVERVRHRADALEERAASIPLADRPTVIRPSSQSVRDLLVHVRKSLDAVVGAASADQHRRVIAVLETFGIT